MHKIFLKTAIFVTLILSQYFLNLIKYGLI